MQYWRIRWDLARFGCAAPSQGTGRNDYLALTAPPLQIDEYKIRFEEAVEPGQSRSDFVYTGDPGVLPCRSTGLELLLSMRVGSHEIHRGRIGSETLYVFCPFREEDALDLGRSNYQTYQGEAGIKWLGLTFLKREFQSGFDVFRFSNDERPRYEIVVSEKFRNEYERRALKGLLFEQILR